MATPKKKPSKVSTPAKKQNTMDVAAEQAREKSESARAKDAQASIRGKMVDIGRGNQQAGRQKGRG